MQRSKLYFLLACFAFGYAFGYIIGYIIDEIAELRTHLDVHGEVLNKVTHDLYFKADKDGKTLVEPCEGCE